MLRYYEHPILLIQDHLFVASVINERSIRSISKIHMRVVDYYKVAPDTNIGEIL